MLVGNLTLDGQDAWLLYTGELGTSVFTGDRPRSIVWNEMGTRLQPWLSKLSS